MCADIGMFHLLHVYVCVVLLCVSVCTFVGVLRFSLCVCVCVCVCVSGYFRVCSDFVRVCVCEYEERKSLLKYYGTN